MKQILAIVFVLLFPVSIPHAQETAPKRTLTVLVVYDTHSSILDTDVRRVLSRVSAELMLEVGLRLEVVKIACRNVDINAVPYDLDRELRKLEKTDIRILVSDIRSKDEREPYGMALLKFGFVRIFEWTHQARLKDRGDHSELCKTIIHELAHLFGAVHDSSPKSFMYESSGSMGHWTKAVRKKFIENIFRVWE